MSITHILAVQDDSIYVAVMYIIYIHKGNLLELIMGFSREPQGSHEAVEIARSVVLLSNLFPREIQTRSLIHKFFSFFFCILSRFTKSCLLF